MKKYQNPILVIIFLVCLLFPRFSQIERPITVDELTWLTFSSDFLFGIASGELEHTYQDHHPGVTTMAAGTAAYALEDRSYRAVGEFVENDTFKLIDLLGAEGFSIFDVLVTARQIMALASSAALLASLWFLWRIWGAFPAWVTMIFVILDPMVIGQTRLYSHEGLMSSLILLAWLSFYHYLTQGQRWSSLLLSGIVMGLAALTKISALGLVPLIGLALLFNVFVSEFNDPAEKKLSWSKIKSILVPFGIWFLVVCLVFIALWPATWANPWKTMIKLIEHTMGFIDSGNLSTSANVSSPSLLEGIGAYLHSIWAHPTLIVWFGNLIALLALIFKRRWKTPAFLTEMNVYAYGYIVILVGAIGGLSSFRADRYMTSAHVLLAFLAGAGVLILIEWLKQLPWFEKRTWVSWLVVAILIVAQIVTILPAKPYYYVYLNPLAGNPWWGVHGAFLDQAADYLAEKPEAESSTVMLFSPGSFMFYYPGDVHYIISKPGWTDSDVRKLEDSDYLVINFELANLNQAPRIIAEISDVEPEYTISFQGREYVWVYPVEDLPASVFVPDP
ncbi:MAG: hypothetical protein ABFS17_13970 [Chloroflexota bacterium]